MKPITGYSNVYTTPWGIVFKFRLFLKGLKDSLGFVARDMALVHQWTILR